MNLRWDARAIQDLRDIHLHIRANASAAAAERVRRNLRSRANLLATRPHMGVATSKPTLRLLQPTRYPYRIYYAVQRDDVVILHIRHTARRAPDDL